LNPFYKPNWSPDYLETFNYLGAPTCLRAGLIKAHIAVDSLYALTLRATELTNNIIHLPVLLCETDAVDYSSERYSQISHENIKALEDRLQRTGRRGTVKENKKHTGCYDIKLKLKHTPLVSIVIPTAGYTVNYDNRDIDLICNIVEEIHSKSSYRNFEIIIVDNDDLSKSQLRKLRSNGCRLTSYKEPLFNISKKLDIGVAMANGELLILMNDDIEIISTDWIERLLEQFEKPHVGIVGAKLLYSDKTIQHAGVVFNETNCGHVRANYAFDEAGYFYSTCGTRNYSAVTGAIMMVRRHVFEELGGYEKALSVSFNDVDFCLKARKKGYTIVYSPFVELFHMESKSRQPVLNHEELSWFHLKWTGIYPDPFYNEKLLSINPPSYEYRDKLEIRDEHEERN
jgi:glycosyltransferase involved in cell wall biosynthesis